MLTDGTGSERTHILKSIRVLDKIKQYYRGIHQQRTAFYQIVDYLRKAYKRSPHLFSKLDIKMIKYLVEYVNNYNNELYFDKEILSNKIIYDLNNGTVVLHKTDYYVGVIVSSRIKIKEKSSKEQDVEKEYRIFISEKEVRFASPFDLIVLGSSEINRCFNCYGLVSIFSKKCEKCHWRICPNCGCCKCIYNMLFKNKKRQAIRKNTDIAISPCVNCRKFGDKSCPGPSKAISSYNRMSTFCAAFSPRHKKG